MPASSELGINPEQEPLPQRYCLVIPGQGGLEVGAGKEEFDHSSLGGGARKVFNFAEYLLSETPGFSIQRLCFEGPQDELALTENTHLALTTIARAKYEAMRERDDFTPPVAIAGQSAGECAAIAIADVVPFHTALQVAEARGRFTAEAGEKVPGRMLWVNDIKGGRDALESYIDEARNGGVLEVSNVNADREFIVSGNKENIEELDKILDGVRNKNILPISFASHCALMEEAEARFADFLAGIPFQEPSIPLIMNGDIVRDPEKIKHKMSSGLTRPVLWPDTVETLDANNVHDMVEITINPLKKPRLSRSTGNISGLTQKFKTLAL